MRLKTRLLSAIVLPLGLAGAVVSGASPAQAATACGDGETRTWPGDIRLANSACADETVVAGGFIKVVGKGAFNVRVPQPGSIRTCTSYVLLYVNGIRVDSNGQSCTTQARAGVISTNTLPARNIEATSSVQVRAYFEVNYRETVYPSGLDVYDTQ